MKTRTTYVTMIALIMGCTISLSQNTEGMDNNSNYSNTRQLVNENTVAVQTGQTTSNRSMAAAELINYQAVARDAGGNLMTNAAVTLDFEIRDGAGGAAVFNETQNLNTDANGVFSAQIGSVSPLAGVNWLDIEPWLQVDLNGTDVGETAIGSGATALHSKQSGQVMIYGSGTGNADKMIAQHSPAFPGWGIAYADVGDDINFNAGGGTNLSIDLASGNLTTDGNIEVLATTTSPNVNTIYGNSVAIAYGSITSAGGINAGYGITSVNNSATGVYNIVIDLNSNAANTIVNITPFTAGFGSPEICGYEPTGANTFTVRIMDETGTATDSAFAFVVYGD